MYYWGWVGGGKLTVHGIATVVGVDDVLSGVGDHLTGVAIWAGVDCLDVVHNRLVSGSSEHPRFFQGHLPRPVKQTHRVRVSCHALLNKHTGLGSAATPC